MAKRARAAKRIEEVEEVEEAEEASAAAGLEFGLLVATTLALVAALFLGFRELGLHYGVGPFAG